VKYQNEVPDLRILHAALMRGCYGSVIEQEKGVIIK